MRTGFLLNYVPFTSPLGEHDSLLIERMHYVVIIIIRRRIIIIIIIIIIITLICIALFRTGLQSASQNRIKHH